jgi:hypothetical protein
MNEEWMFTPVFDENGVPVMMLYTCPHCGTVSLKEYALCPNPFCHKPLDPD